MRKTLTVITIIAVVALFAVLYKVWERSRIVPVKTATVVIPEGETVADINQRLQASNVLSPGEALPESLEGYLFPDTYQFYVSSSLPVVEKKFAKNFDAKVLPIIPHADNLKNILVVASLVQVEAKTPSDMRIVSGIIWKRLQAGMPLQLDSTICYIKATTPCLPITKADLAINSPYNTYLHRGLPPGPIDNPGLNAIEAALYPQATPYWYYLSVSGSGKMVFAKTLDEQEQNIVKYLK